MTQYALTVGSDFTTSLTVGDQNINWDCPTNPILKNSLSAAASVVCYELHDDNSSLSSPATNGVSYSSSYSTLNRIYPSDATVASYLSNLENTPGYKIRCYETLSSTGQDLSGLSLATNDYFVMIFADNYKTHHFARIKEITKDDVAGDSFEFEPQYNGEIAKDTKFAIYKGPLLTDTSVVALMYGGQGSGDGSDSRHDIYTNCSRPLFYFYNARLDKNNQLNHNTKYALYYSRWDGSSETHAVNHFVTEQDYGLRVVDYGPYTTAATLVDSNRVDDIPGTSSGANERYGTNRTSYTNTYTGWDTCFLNIRRTTDNKIKANTSGNFTGPTRYIHYADSSGKNNIIPRIMDVNIFQSITKTGTYFEGKIADPHKIMGSKLSRFDKIKVRQTIAEGSIRHRTEASLFGTVNGTSGANTLTFSKLAVNQDLRIILKNSSGAFETIRIGDYHYTISSIGAPAYGMGTESIEQVITIDKYRKFTSTAFSSASANLQENIVDGTAKRQRWGKVTGTLLVDFPIDTEVTHANADSRDVAASALTYNGTALTAFSESRINNLELVLIGGEYSGHRITVNYGDSVNGYIKINTSRVTLYQKESLDYPNMLDYFSGSFTLDKVIFSGIIENIEEEIEDGLFTYKIHGRNDINRLLGPIINKNYEYSKDWIYSTQLPFFLTSSGASPTSNVEVGANTFTASSAAFSDGDLLFIITGSGKSLVGRAYGISGTTINIEGRTRVYVPSGTTIYVQHSSYDYIGFGKSIQANGTASSTATSLRGAANKGIIFNSGLKLTKSGGIPATDGASLIGTSSHSDTKARGYYINYPKEISGDSATGLPWFSRFADELSTSTTYSEIDTINSLSNYNVVSIDSNDNETTIELAPNCPAVLARADCNPIDSRLRTFTGSYLQTKGSYSAGENGRILLDGNTVAANVYLRYGRGKPLFQSDGTYIGTVERLEVSAYTASTAAITEWEILLDRKIPNALSDNEEIYFSSTGVEGDRAHNLYLLNTQGLYLGGILHMLHPEYVREASSYYQPITFAFKHNATVAATIGNTALIDTATQFGDSVYRYYDLQKGSPGSIYYNKKLLSDGLTNRLTYSANRGNVSAYAIAHKGLWDDKRVKINENNRVTSIDVNEFIRTHQFSPERRGVDNSHGSAYEDFEIYSDAAVTPALNKMPHYHHASSSSDGSDWAATTGTSRIEGYKENAITRARDKLEIVDPKMLRWFIFSPGDIFPESMRRQNHLGYSARDLSDYTLILQGDTTKEATNIKHHKYLGTLPREVINDNSFEHLSINSASISGNEIKRTGLMRLRELTFDWHFNLVDPELPPNRKDLVEAFDYTVFLPVKNTAFYTGIGNDVEIEDTGDYNSAKTIITPNTNNNGSGGKVFDAGDRLYTTDGRYLGEVSSATTSAITLTAVVNFIDGALYVGLVYKLKYDNNSNTNASWRASKLHGRDGGNALWDIDVTAPKDLDMLQGAILNSNHPNSGQTSANWDANWSTGADLSSESSVIIPPVFTHTSDTIESPLTTTNLAIGAGQQALHYKLGPSRFLNNLNIENSYFDHVYRGCKAVILGRYGVENKGEYEAGIGSVVDLNDIKSKLNPAGSNKWAFLYADTEQVKNIFNASTHTATAFSSQDAKFAAKNINDATISVGTSDSRIDGINFVMKPLLHVGGYVNTTSRPYPLQGGAKEYVAVSPSGATNLVTWEFTLTSATGSTKANVDNDWLKYVPNLTGCYLVGTEAYLYGTNTLNSAEAGGFEGTWDDDDTSDIGKAATVSVEGTHPLKMHYVLSHTVATSGSAEMHYLTIDNMYDEPAQFYRVMQPAEVCFWPKTPTSINLYEMSSKYTKRPDSEDMYGDTPHITLWDEGNVSGRKDQYGYNDAVQSMYVIVDVDNMINEELHIVPRPTSGYKSAYSKIFGVNRVWEDPNTYDVLLNDGNNQLRRGMFVETAASSVRNCRLTFSDEFEKMLGIVSMGEIFTVKTSTSPNLRNIKKASIASSVTICQEGEQIINDLLESNNIDYTTTTNSFPYFIAPDFRGIDLYSAIEFVANFKNKRIIITPDGIKLRPDTEDLDYVDIKLTSANTDIKIAEVSRGESLFDLFNEIIVYGNGVKATRRDRKSINNVGKKTLEEVDETLVTQQEVNERALSLLKLHSEGNNRITIKCTNSGLELLKPGDIITLDFSEHRIDKGKYLVLEMKHSLYGLLELEVGKYNKGLSERFAEIIQTQKRTSAFARASKFKTTADTTDFFESFRLKELRFKIEKTTVTSSPFTVGFNYPVDTLVSGGNTGAPIGFNTSLGSVTKSVELDEDLT